MTSHIFHIARRFTLVSSIALIFAPGCGAAPTVFEDDDAALAEDEQGSTSGAAGDGSSPNSPQASTSRDEEVLVPFQDASESTPTTAADESAEECAPSLFPSSNNVTYEVTETVTETIEVEVERELSSTALLLLDRSLSMREYIDGSEMSRWDTMQDVLFGGEQPLLSSLASEVYLGMTHFTARRSSTGADGSGHCVDLTVPVEDISFEMDNFEALAAQQADVELGYGTPTGEALRATTDAFKNVETSGNKHIVVVTDGEPAHCNALLDFSSEQAVDYVLDAAKDAAAMGVTVHVIGIGPDVNQQHLEDMAAAGGGMYRSALTGDSLQEAFSEILAAVRVVEVEEVVEEREVTREVTAERRSCSFDMEFGRMGADAFLEGGNVRLGDQELTLDDTDGWTINAADELELLGAACAAYLEEESQLELEVELACPNRFPGFAR